MTQPNSFAALLTRMHELRDLAGIANLATWDQETFMPAKASRMRGEQLGTIQGLYHERLSSPALAEQIAWAQAQSLSQPERAMVDLLAFERDRAVKIPVELVRALAQAQSEGVQAWKAARAEKSFKLFQPALARLVKLRREQADHWLENGSTERYDALLAGYERHMTVSRLMPVLDALQAKLTPLLQRVAERYRAKPRVLQGRHFPKAGQWAFTLELLKAMRFDFEAGRQDESIHPFTGGTGPEDVRLTTHVDEKNPLPAIFSTIHEGGHGLYEQGFNPAHFRTPVANAPSMGLHESQSRLWENVIGRSLPFWRYFYPRLQALVPEGFQGITLEQFVDEATRVERSLIRIEADEVSYNLHICLRTQLEVAILRDDLPLSELPAAWNDTSEKLLGLRPKNDLEGVLQDIHWAWGELGYFPTYALGNLYSASLFKALRRDLPDVDAQLSRGELGGVVGWLRQHVHQQGSLQSAEALVERATGRGLTDEDFLSYLNERYLANG